MGLDSFITHVKISTSYCWTERIFLPKIVDYLHSVSFLYVHKHSQSSNTMTKLYGGGDKEGVEWNENE